jgi:hypothetical protein
VAPQARSAFDPLRYIRWSDVTITKQGITVHLRWTITLQKYNQSALIPLFTAPNSIACPLAAFCDLQRSYPVFPTDPLLSKRIAGQLFVVSQRYLKTSLKKLISMLGYNSALSFHSLTRSGASLAFTSGVPFQAIQAHGTWASDALWAKVPAFFSVFSSL